MTLAIARPVDDRDACATRRPPYSEDAEQAVLSAAMGDENALLAALEVIGPDAFYADRHRRIFRGMVALLECGMRVDPLTLTNRLEGTGELQSVGGKDYIGHLVDAVPTFANIAHHARIVREKHERRRLIEHAQAAMTDAMTTDRPIAEIASELQGAVLPLSVSGQREGFVRVKDDIWAVMESLEAAARGERNTRVIPTGYPEIDENIAGGFERGHFIVLAGVPGSAKTAIVLNIMLNAASAAEPVGALFVSAEMTRHQVIKRSLANLARVSLSSIRGGRFEDGDWPRLATGSGLLSRIPLWVDETPMPTIEDVVAKCRQKKAEHPSIGLLLVDYIQLVQRQHAADKRNRDDNRSAELTRISVTLQGLAKELDVAVIATSQVDAAEVEKSADKRPKLHQARWSQSMRESAHLFATVYRPRMYDTNAADTVELGFLKGRDDPPFVAVLDWVGQHMLMRSRRPPPPRAVQEAMPL